MVLKKTKFKDVFIFAPKRHKDGRGFLMEVYRKDVFSASGLDVEFVQINQSYSIKNTIRGLHFQWDPPLGKLIRVVSGSIFAVAVDIRKKSGTFGKWLGIELSVKNKKQMYVPPGFATGFCVLSDGAGVEYYYTALYNPKGESNLLWNDGTIKIKWPIREPVLSKRDRKAQSFKEWLEMPESDQF